MRFYFVDKITEVGDDFIKGTMGFDKECPTRYLDWLGQPIIAPAIIGECLGQLVSWLVMSRGNFTGRPVFLIADKFEIFESAKPGSTLELSSNITRQDDESIIFCAEASAEGRVLVRITNCTNFLIPISELEDPAETAKKFKKLTNEGIYLKDSGPSYDFSSHLAVGTCEPNQAIEVNGRIPSSESFYRDHFPRSPITPIVVINELINRSVSWLLDPSGDGFVFPREVTRLKMRSFVKPDEDFKIQVKLKNLIESQDDAPAKVEAAVVIVKDDKRIMNGMYSFDFYKKA